MSDVKDSARLDTELRVARQALADAEVAAAAAPRAADDARQRHHEARMALQQVLSEAWKHMHGNDVHYGCWLLDNGIDPLDGHQIDLIGKLKGLSGGG